MEFFPLNDELTVRGIYTMGYQEKGVDFLFPGEKHDFWELLYMDKGYLNLIINDTGYKANQGDLFLFGKNQNHVVWSDKDVTPCFLTISFELRFSDENYFEYKRFKVNEDIKELMKKIMAERLNLFDGNIYNGITAKKNGVPLGSEQLISMHLAEILIKLYRMGAENKNANQTSLIRKKSGNAIFAKCEDFITRHITEKISLDAICRNIPISKSYLNRIFKDTAGIPVVEYINGAKLEKAKELIREGNLNITEISDLLGFSSIHYFSNLFKAKYRIAPREYSKSLKLFL